MGAVLTRDTLMWVNEYGSRNLVKDLSDQHVANIIDFLKAEKGRPMHAELVRLFNDEAGIRGLSKEFLSRAQIPHIGPDGRWMVWDFKKHKNVAVSEAEAKPNSWL